MEELKARIKDFWKTLTPSACKKYIQHLKKVIPKVIQENGGLSEYYITCNNTTHIFVCTLSCSVVLHVHVLFFSIDIVKAEIM